jgi:hypothetical protein
MSRNLRFTMTPAERNDAITPAVSPNAIDSTTQHCGEQSARLASGQITKERRIRSSRTWQTRSMLPENNTRPTSAPQTVGSCNVWKRYYCLGAIITEALTCTWSRCRSRTSHSGSARSAHTWDPTGHQYTSLSRVFNNKCSPRVGALPELARPVHPHPRVQVEEPEVDLGHGRHTVLDDGLVRLRPACSAIASRWSACRHALHGQGVQAWTAGRFYDHHKRPDCWRQMWGQNARMTYHRTMIVE